MDVFGKFGTIFGYVLVFLRQDLVMYLVILTSLIFPILIWLND